MTWWLLIPYLLIGGIWARCWVVPIYKRRLAAQEWNHRRDPHLWGNPVEEAEFETLVMQFALAVFWPIPLVVILIRRFFGLLGMGFEAMLFGPLQKHRLQLEQAKEEVVRYQRLMEGTSDPAEVEVFSQAVKRAEARVKELEA